MINIKQGNNKLIYLLIFQEYSYRLQPEQLQISTSLQNEMLYSVLLNCFRNSEVCTSWLLEMVDVLVGKLPSVYCQITCLYDAVICRCPFTCYYFRSTSYYSLSNANSLFKFCSEFAINFHFTSGASGKQCNNDCLFRNLNNTLNQKSEIKVILLLQDGRIAQWQSACPRTKKSVVRASTTAPCCGGELFTYM